MTPTQETAADYRAYLLDSNDHIKGRHDFEAKGDGEALEFAQRYVGGHDVEIWLRTHIVGRLKRTSTPP